jgi:OOP family OmpA-OmpF porin
MVECLQPDRRVVVEVNGTRTIPAPAPKPGEAAGKPTVQPFELKGMAQGNIAFAPNASELLAGGKEELDAFWRSEVMGKIPPQVNAVIITGHSDKLEGGSTNLSEARAKSVRDYLVSKGVDSKLMFWEGRGSREPVPVTKFCS